MKVGVGLLTYERPALLQRTLDSLWPRLAAAGLPVAAVIVDNGSSSATLRRVETLVRAAGAHLLRRPEPLPPSDDLAERDRRIASGFATISEGLLATDCTHALLIEDDWECTGPLPLAALMGVLDARPHLGQIRLRACAYDNSLTGYSTRHFVTRRQIVFGPEQPVGRSALAEAEMHWTNNPSLVRREALAILTEDFGSEMEIIRAFHRRHARNAQLRPGVFVHAGPVRRRPDLEAAGAFGPVN